MFVMLVVFNFILLVNNGTQRLRRGLGLFNETVSLTLGISTKHVILVKEVNYRKL